MPETAITLQPETVLTEETWQHRLHQHQQRVDDAISDFLAKRERGHRHPVLDFLFEYYSFRPSYLRRWSPGIDVGLENGDPKNFAGTFGFRSQDDVRYLDPALFPKHRLDGLNWTLSLLEQTMKRSPSMGCYGLHEWAMVYKQGHQRRHTQVPLRMHPDDLDAFVESRTLVCTHYDAFRFYTKDARPLNQHKLSRETFPENEQPGCLHTNMDLYKWAYKFYPWISSDLIADCFDFAVDIRTVDMKASPYDLTGYGYDPIPIETEEGRRQYRQEQKRIYETGIPLRKRLFTELQKLNQTLQTI